MQTFREDTRPDKVDLGIGVYKDDSGNTPIMAAVHQAERSHPVTGRGRNA
jgi:aspartate aminotransferase